MGQFGGKTGGKTKVVWTSTEERCWSVGRMMLRMELSGKGKRGRPTARFTDAVREDMAVVEATEKDAVNPLWRPLAGAVEIRRYRYG